MLKWCSISMSNKRTMSFQQGNNVVWITPITFLHYWSRSGFDFSKTVTRVQDLSILENLKFKYLGKWDSERIFIGEMRLGKLHCWKWELRSNVNGLKEELGHASTNFNYTYKKIIRREREENWNSVWIMNLWWNKETSDNEESIQAKKKNFDN